jgi:hypothetical protein
LKMAETTKPAAAPSGKDPVPTPSASGTVVSDYSVGAALKAMRLTTEFKAFIIKHRELWSTYGRMDSNLYRAKLMRIMDSASLLPEDRMIVHFFFCLVKTKSRVLAGMENMSDEVKSMAWFGRVKNFIATYIVDYNTASKNANKFPGTHIPTTNPGLDLYLWKLTVDRADRTVDMFFARTTSVQIKLDTVCQAKSHDGYKKYWEEVVKGTKNTTKTEDPKYREDYYKTSAGDEYYLTTDGRNFLKPSNEKTGYTLEEIEAWLKQEA